MEKSEKDHHWLHAPHSECYHDALCVLDGDHIGECVYGKDAPVHADECSLDTDHTGGCSYGAAKEDKADLNPALVLHNHGIDIEIGEVKVDETPAEPEFEDQNFQPPIYITLARMYDLLAVIALSADPKRAEEILNAHESGHLWAEAPYLVLDTIEEVDNEQMDI